MSQPDLAEIEPLYRAWLIRHELPDAHARWRDAEADRAPLLAFTAVASDSNLLQRLGRTALVLAEQANAFAADVIGKPEVSAEARAAAHVVRGRLQQWRQRFPGRPAPEPQACAGEPSQHAPAGPKTLTLSDHLRIALHDHPYFRETTARALFYETLRLGAAGLQVVGAPFDEAIMLATARYAARCWRGLIRGEVPARQECMTAVALVQQWGARAGKNPFMVDFVGVTGALEDLVVGLCRDAATCLAIASRFSDGASAPGFGLWEEAEEFLSFAVLSLRPNYMTNMSMDHARAFAGAAARLAATAVGDETVRVPAFAEGVEAGGPRRVLATTKFALPNGIDLRRSARMPKAAGS